jgi:hypothetical protein
VHTFAPARAGAVIYGGNPLPTGLRATHARLCVLAPEPPPHSLPWLLLLAGGIFRDPVCVPSGWSSDFHGEFHAGPSLHPTCACRRINVFVSCANLTPSVVSRGLLGVTWRDSVRIRAGHWFQNSRAAYFGLDGFVRCFHRHLGAALLLYVNPPPPPNPLLPSPSSFPCRLSSTT